MLVDDAGERCPRCLQPNAHGATTCRHCRATLSATPPSASRADGWSSRLATAASAVPAPPPAGDWFARPTPAEEPAAPVEVGVDVGTSARFFVSIALGLVTAAIAIAILAAAATRTGYLLSSITVLFVVPVGGVIAGGVAASGLAGGLRGLHVRPPGWVSGVAALLGVIAFAGATYALYALTYVDDTLTVNHERRGEHISTFINAETGAPITFLDWLKVEVAGRSGSFLGSTTPSVSFEFLGTTASTLNWALFGLEGLGFVVGAIGIIANVRAIPYCAACRRFMSTRQLAAMPADALPGHWDRLLGAVAARRDVPLAIQEAGAQPIDKKKEHARIEFARCTRCGRGELRAQSMAGKHLEDHTKQRTRRLTAEEAALVAGP